MTLPRGYISHSQIRLYSECPAKYFFTYIEEIRPRINEKIFLGEVFHTAIEQYFLRQISGSPLDAVSTVEFFLANFNSLAQEREIDWKTPRRETRERGVAFVKYFLAHIAPTIRPMLVEKELAVDIPEIGVCLKGIIDLIEEDFSITDFKTASSKWSAGKARNSLQMLIYKYLFDRSFGQVHASLKYEILYAKNAGSIKHQTLKVNPGPDDIAQMLILIGHVAENIGNGIFYPRPNPFCAYCDFFTLCQEKNPSLTAIKK